MLIVTLDRQMSVVCVIRLIVMLDTDVRRVCVIRKKERRGGRREREGEKAFFFCKCSPVKDTKQTYAYRQEH